MTEPQPTPAELARANQELRAQLEEAQDLIDAIRTGAVDALAVQSADGPRIFTLQGADQSYRTLIEQMNEGALLLSENGTVLYCNASLARLLGRPLAEVIGSAFGRVVPAAYQEAWAELLLKSWRGRSRGELPLLTQSGALVPVSVSLNVLDYNDMPALAVQAICGMPSRVRMASAAACSPTRRAVSSRFSSSVFWSSWAFCSATRARMASTSRWADKSVTITASAGIAL